MENLVATSKMTYIFMEDVDTPLRQEHQVVNYY